MSPKRIDTDSDFSDDRCWPYGVGTSQAKTRLASPRDYFSVEHVAPHELGANCRVVPMAVLVEWAARFDKLATRDAAEGNEIQNSAGSTCGDFSQASQRHNGDLQLEPAETATPKPAPDAMRSGPAVVTDEMVSAAIEAAWPGPEIVYADGHDSAEAMMRAALEAALAAPVPSLDGAVLRDSLTRLATRHVGAWIKESNPALQMFPVAADQDIRDFIKDVLALLPTSAAGAVEPDAQMLEYARRLNDIAVDVELAQGGLGGAANASDLRRIAQQIVATPPVRRDRESEVVEYIKMAESRLRAAMMGEEPCKPCIDLAVSYLQEAKSALSLPVQPGAGEREERIAKASALARKLCQLFDSGGESQRTVRARHASAIFQLLGSDETEQKQCDADPVCYLERCERTALSRQPPQSSREEK